MNLIFITVLVAIGLKVLLGWSFWTIMIIIGLGAGLNLIRVRYGNVWAGAVGVVATIVILAIITVSQVAGKFPATMSAKHLIFLAKDIAISAKAEGDGLTAAKEALLRGQREYENRLAPGVYEYARKGEAEIALARLDNDAKTATRVRNFVSGSQAPAAKVVSATASPLINPAGTSAASYQSRPTRQTIKLGLGKHQFALESLEQTAWLEVPGDTTYDVYLPDEELGDGFKLYFTDGSVRYINKEHPYQAVSNKPLATFKISSNSNSVQHFTVTVKPRTISTS